MLYYYLALAAIIWFRRDRPLHHGHIARVLEDIVHYPIIMIVSGQILKCL